MKHFIKAIVVVVVLLSFYTGYFLGIKVDGRPKNVLPYNLMQNTWNTWKDDLKILIQNEIIRNGIALDSEHGKSLFEQFHGDFEPMVFCHPFIILKRKDNSGYKVFINKDIKYQGFDNLAAPTLDFRESKDDTGATCNEYTFSTPLQIGKETTGFIALVRTDKENNRTSTIVNILGIKKNEGFFYRDLDADGIFESIVHIDSLSLDKAKKTRYSITKFAEKFCSPRPETFGIDSTSETDIEN